MSNIKNMSKEQLEAAIAQLQQENTALKQRSVGGKLSLKVSTKGAVSIYGLGRFPVTLYGEQWLKLIEFMPNVKAFIETNQSLLSTKENPRVAEATAQVQA